jgi:hypothetical protein
MAAETSKKVMRVAAVVLAAGAPATSHAQSATVLVGRFYSYDPGFTEGFRAYSLRLDHALLPWLLADIGAEHAAVVQRRADGPGRRGRPVSRYATPRRSGDLQLQVQIPTGGLRPFIGAGSGVMTFRDLPDSSGVRVRRQGTTHTLVAGVRLGVMRHVGLRAEVRGVYDRPSVSFGAWSVHPTAGVAWRW